MDKKIQHQYMDVSGTFQLRKNIKSLSMVKDFCDIPTSTHNIPICRIH